jgi:tetrapyrrole methylase family protein/MazG family protein
VQTHRTLRPYLLEETYELLEAIETGESPTLREELGDLLLQVLMHCAIAAEAPDAFDIGDVAETTRAKMIHRHPHVFGDTSVSGAAQVVVNWERLKRVEKKERLSLLEGVPKALPALAYAQGVQKRPARVGFDESPSVADALGRVRAGVDAVAAVAAASPVRAERGEDWAPAETAKGSPAVVPAGLAPDEHVPPPPPPPAEVEAVIGELLFATVSLARQLRVNPEDALRGRATLFADRFRRLEASARAEGVDLHDVDADSWRARWEATAV